MADNTQSRKVLVLKLMSRVTGEYQMRYAEVDETDFERWSKYLDNHDYESMKREAPMVLRMIIPESEYDKRMDPSTMDGFCIFIIPGLFAEDYKP